jgi:predicted O-methyltransferase YrrM
MGRMYTAYQFVSHYLRSRKWSAFHSPYLFKLFTYCCEDRPGIRSFKEIESKRKELLSSQETISRRDFGAGSVYQPKEEKVPVSKIAKSSLSYPFQCRFMSMLATFSNANRILELGTSLGISAAYYSIGAQTAQIDTVEGDPEISKKATTLLRALHLKNVTVHCETFDDFISQYNPSSGKLDLLFLDGNHRMEATLQYYQGLKKYFHSETVVIVDDIYWSKEMTTCWEKLISFPEVTQSVSCFHFGLLFYNKDFLNKEDHEVHLPLRMLMR